MAQPGSGRRGTGKWKLLAQKKSRREHPPQALAPRKVQVPAKALPRARQGRSAVHTGPLQASGGFSSRGCSVEQACGTSKTGGAGPTWGAGRTQLGRRASARSGPPAGAPPRQASTGFGHTGTAVGCPAGTGLARLLQVGHPHPPRERPRPATFPHRQTWAGDSRLQDPVAPRGFRGC